MKEYRVYVFEYNTYLPDWYKSFQGNLDDDAIENFYHYEEVHGKLSPEAQKFIELCEQDGSVYTLETFIRELNRDHIYTNNHLFYTTNNY